MIDNSSVSRSTGRFCWILIFLFSNLMLATHSVNAGIADWKILVLIYASTDFSFTDSAGGHHVVAMMSDFDKLKAESVATYFFQNDVPLLTSGHMSPTVTIRFPVRVLTSLDEACGYWPSPSNTAPELDSSFDSVIVIWKSAGIDLTTGQNYDLQQCGGLAVPRGNGQTYAAFQVDSVSYYERNIFKHEWGHSILFYFDGAGTAPKPTVDNHINATTTRYVHCGTGSAYILQDETDVNPIPNSIYNNYSGFTHDYYSGTTALPQRPTQCLGINENAWDSGGPVTIPIPQPTSPANHSTITETRPLFRWQSIAKGLIYELQFGLTSPPTTLIYASNAATYQVQTMLLPATYYWRVRMKRPDGTTSEWSETQSFTLISQPDIEPVHNYYTTTTPTLTWNEVIWATLYQVQVSTDIAFTQPLPYTASVMDLQTTTWPLLKGVVYYWRVRACITPGNCGPWSEADTFAIAP